MSITRQKFCYLVVLNKKFLMLLASDLLLLIEQVLSQIGISTDIRQPLRTIVTQCESGDKGPVHLQSHLSLYSCMAT
ncbi:hypothetical protein EAG18_16730 [Pseudoalteromonas sp. J010]|nr:hypothetical protein EAG18_16730 [Pseudoalteromonas sp. J010]